MGGGDVWRQAVSQTSGSNAVQVSEGEHSELELHPLRRR